MTAVNTTSVYKVYIYESEYKSIIAGAQQFLHKETGGTLYGTLTYGMMFVVWLASAPGKQAWGTGGEFQQDADFINRWQKKLMKEYAVQYIGGWHSHHTLGIRRPSSGDTNKIQQYNLRANRQVALEIIVTHENSQPYRHYTTVPHAFYYDDIQNGRYALGEFVILPGESPLRRCLQEWRKEFFINVDWKQVNPDFRPPRSEWDNRTSTMRKQTHGDARQVEWNLEGQSQSLQTEQFFDSTTQTEKNPKMVLTNESFSTFFDKLQLELRVLATEVELEQKEKYWMIKIPLYDGFSLSVVFDSSITLHSAKASLVNYFISLSIIDHLHEKSHDITSKLENSRSVDAEASGEIFLTKVLLQSQEILKENSELWQSGQKNNG